MFKMICNDYPLNLLHRYVYHPQDDTLSMDERTLITTNDSWGQRSVKWWNQLPYSLRIEQNPRKFKKSLCLWTMENIEMFASKDEGDGNDDI